MITRIELVNFMSHERTVIEPAAGLTVLVGPNNCGKSAVVAALQILCRNDASTYVLRHGERECSVWVETDDGHAIVWKRKSGPSYEINGQKFDRLRGSGLPEELHQALRLPKVDAGDDADFDVHFGMQKSPIFLLGNSSSNAARFFASSSDAIRLVQMQKRHKEKVQEAQRERNRLEADYKRVNSELLALAPAVELEHHVKALEAQHFSLLQQTTEIAAAQTWHTELARQAQVVVEQAALSGALAGLQMPPVIAPTDLLERLAVALRAAERARQRAEAQAAALATVQTPPSMHDVRSIELLLEKIIGTQGALALSEAERQALAAVAAPPALQETSSLIQCIDKLAAAEVHVRVHEVQQQSLQELGQRPECADIAPLAALVAALEGRYAEVTRCERALVALSSVQPLPVVSDPAALEVLVRGLARQELEVKAAENLLTETQAAQEEAAAKLRAYAAGNVCPTCGGPLDADRLLAGAVTGQLGGHAHA